MSNWYLIAFGALALHVSAPPLAAERFSDPLMAPALETRHPADSALNAITLAGSRLVAVGRYGRILWSEDQGEHWQQAKVAVQSDLTAVSFATASDGWAVGHDGVVLHTQDGGQSWELQLDGAQAAHLMQAQLIAKAAGHEASTGVLLEVAAQFVADGADKPFLDVWFQDNRHGYVVGAFGLIFQTQDGGQNWQTLIDRTDNPEGMHLYALRGGPQGLFIAGERGLLQKWDTSAQRFTRVDVHAKGSLFGLQVAKGGVYAYGMLGTVLFSADGVGWQELPSNETGSLLASTRLPDGRPILLSQTGNLLTLSPSGKIDRRPAKAGLPMSAIAIKGDQLLLAGERGLRRIDLP